MYVILEIPIDAYLNCLSWFEGRSAEYVMVRNGITLKNNRGEGVVHIRCHLDRVTPLLNMVSGVCPEFIEKVRQLPDMES